MSNSAALKANSSFQGPTGTIGPTGPAGTNGAPGNLSFGGDIYTGPTGPTIRQLYGYSMLGVTGVGGGGNIDVLGSRTTNRSTVKGRTFTDEIEFTTTATGWQPMYAYTIDTVAVTNLDGVINAVSSGAAQAAVFKRAFTLRNDGATSWSVPSGAVCVDNGSKQDNSFWNATMTYSGPTGVCFVRGSDTTINWYGIFQRMEGGNS